MQRYDPPEIPSARSPEERIVHLENLIMHLQYDLEQLNAAFLAQQTDLSALREQVARIERRQDVADDEPERRDPMAERPPHY